MSPRLPLRLGAFVAATILLGACNVADVAKEKAAERAVGYDIEYYEDENGERKARPADGPIAWQVDFDESRLNNVELPEGYVITDVSENPDFGAVNVTLTAPEDDEIVTAADDFEAMLTAAGWAVDRTSDDESVTLKFEQDPSTGTARFYTSRDFGTVQISLNYVADPAVVGWLAFDLPDPDGLVDKTTTGSNEWNFVAEAADVEAAMRAYAASLRAAGWTIGEPSAQGEEFWDAELSAEGQTGIVRVVRKRATAEDDRQLIDVTVRIFQL